MTRMSWLLVALKRFLARHMLLVEFCHDCGRQQPLVWTASDELWADVSGEPDGGGVLCPRCFDYRARALDYYLRWVPMVEARRSGVPESEEPVQERPVCKRFRHDEHCIDEPHA